MGKSTRNSIKYPEKLTDIFIYLALSFFILFPGTKGYLGIQQEKQMLFYAIFGGYVALMVLFTGEMAIMGQIKPVSPAELRKKLTATQKLVLIFWIISVISAFASEYFPKTVLGMSRGEGIVTITIYCFTMVCVSSFAKPKKQIIYVFGAVMTVFCIICLLQLAGKNPLGLYPEGYDYFGADADYSGRFLGTTGNADITSSLLSMAIPVFWIYILRDKDTKRFSLIIPLCLCVTVSVMLGVSAGLAALAAGTVIAVPAVYPGGKKGRRALWLCALALTAGFVVFALTSNAVSGTVYELGQILRGNIKDEFGSGRISIWKSVLALCPEHIFLGHGPDTLSAANIEMASHVFDGGYALLTVDTAHNEYINILYHQGIIALAAYAAALSVSGWKWIKESRANAAAAVCGGAVLYYAIQAFFGISMCSSAGIFWLAWGLTDNQSRKLTYEGI